MPEVRDNPGRGRYELLLDDGSLAGHADYREGPGGAVLLPHTEVDPRYEGRGYGSLLVKGTLDGLRAQGRQVLPRCSFVSAYIARHPEYATLLAGT